MFGNYFKNKFFSLFGLKSLFFVFLSGFRQFISWFKSSCFKYSQLVKNFISIRLIAQVIIFLVGLLISSFGLFQLLGNNSQAFEYSGVSVNSFVHGGIDEDGDIRSSVNNSDNDSIATKNNNIKNNGDVDGNTIANNVVTNEYIDENSARVCEKNPDFGHLIVDIGGAVQTPGVYELDAGSRVNDLINLAGGFSDTVDKYYINKVLNLSERLVDGKKFYIPTLAESIELQKVTHKKDSFQDEVNNIVSINFSSKELLTSLAGIGDKRANDIVANRPYNSIQELVENKIITQFIFDTIKNDISL